jgi:hypothetical protein
LSCSLLQINPVGNGLQAQNFPKAFPLKECVSFVSRAASSGGAARKPEQPENDSTSSGCSDGNARQGELEHGAASFLASIVPPWRSMMAFTIERPRPLPPDAVRAASTL